MERPIVRREKFEQEVMILALYGDMSNYQLKELGNDIKDELQALPQINLVNFYSGLNYEIGIEISPDKLREYGLTFRDIATAVRSFLPICQQVKFALKMATFRCVLKIKRIVVKSSKICLYYTYQMGSSFLR